jgi:hypothetical protein
MDQGNVVRPAQRVMTEDEKKAAADAAETEKKARPFLGEPEDVVEFKAMKAEFDRYQCTFELGVCLNTFLTRKGEQVLWPKGKPLPVEKADYFVEVGW